MHCGIPRLILEFSSGERQKLGNGLAGYSNCSAMGTEHAAPQLSGSEGCITEKPSAHHDPGTENRPLVNTVAGNHVQNIHLTTIPQRYMKTENYDLRLEIKFSLVNYAGCPV